MSSTRVWALTAAGVRLSEMALQRRVTYLTHPERLSISRLTHELAVQHEALARLPTDLPALRRLRADRELREVGATARPDLVIRHVDSHGVDTTVCIEVEITSKGETELRAKLLAVLRLLTPRTLWLWCVTEGEATRQRYERTWTAIVEEAGDGYTLPRTALLRACVFELAAAKKA